MFLSKIFLLCENISNAKKYATKYQNSLFKLYLKTILHFNNVKQQEITTIKNYRQKKKKEQHIYITEIKE